MPPVGTEDNIEQRKRDHLELCLNEDVQFQARRTLLADVRLLHEALPELDANALDLSVPLAGKTLRAPLYISGMTGGTAEAVAINRDLAAVAEEMGIAFGFGSQRPLLKDASQLPSYQVRDVAPSALLFGNLGLVQAGQYPVSQIKAMVADTQIDALCLHLNPAQEMMQAHGDRNFRGGLETLRRLRGELTVPLIVKETGCGISARTAEKIKQAGIGIVDVAGAGGTSWVGVETRRAANDRKPLGYEMWDWGIPTAASLLQVRQVTGLTVLASGGLRSGTDVAHAIALGATACGMAQPYLKARHEGGRDGIRALVLRLIDHLKMTMVLTGSRTIAELQQAPRVLVGELSHWAGQAPTSR
jgi:isopentenyl-diphosphate delta-isomerase